MLAVAQTLVSEGAAIHWIEGSALDLPFQAGKFDLVLCQLGLQFFPDQGRALREMRRVLSPSGRVALSVYSPIERTPGANAFALALDRVLGPNASKIKRGEHSFNAPDELRELLTQFVEQARVLDGDYRLIGEGLSQLDLLVGEGTN
jgi:ubiquinone/menaquinone biosynthesis C-methylase UbiE